MTEQIRETCYRAMTESIAAAKLRPGDVVVVGCSSSEVLGEKIGTHSSLETAQAIFEGLYAAAQEAGMQLAAQCCEHLNRAIIIERALADRMGLDEVNVVPQPKAGGSFATTAYARFADPVAVEHIRAHAGLDIGDTFIGMHLREVAVPVRLSMRAIGEAHLTAARVRPKSIGGARAVYNDALK